MKLRSLVLLASLLALSWSAPALAVAPTTDAGIREAITETLAMRHPKDTAEWWRGLGPKAPHVMIEMFEASTRTYHRLRLLEALGWFTDDGEAAAFLKDQASRKKQEDVLRAAAIRSVGRAQGAREREFVAAFLDDADADIRVAAAQSLKLMGDAEANERVEKYLTQEKAAWIAAKVRGLPAAQPTAALTPTSAKIGAAPAEWARHAGTWNGVWITPKPKTAGSAAAPTMLAQDATLVLSADGRAELTVAGKVLYRVSILPEAPGGWKGAAYPMSSGEWILDVRLPVSGFTFLGRKSAM
jgi:hypothetical protein